LRAEKTALRLIARAEQCSGGLARKLKKRGFDTVSINRVISQLAELDLLDDSRFARLWLQSRLRFTRSPRRLLSSLCARGVDRNDAETALKAVLDKDTEFALLAQLVRKCPQKNRGGALSLKFFLKSEGFSTAAIHQFLELEEATLSQNS
jgi:regulatory protein